ncbi:MAG: hypothetical protein GY913_06710 [Proteobacteria bacterium]|nr:hypothetical protein [Pseudomonadota bacterium]MCP4916597.1 hypothetical protein [Pseudomonadota bacterium]
MLTGTVVWLLVKAHRDALTGCLRIRTGDQTVALHVRGRDLVAIQGIPSLLREIEPKLPSPAALTGDLSADIPVCMALGILLDDLLSAACQETGEVIATLAQDPGAEATFDGDEAAPPGAFPLPRGLLRCFKDGLRAVRDADDVVAELTAALDNPLRVTAKQDDLDDLGTIALRTAKLARTEGTLRGLIAASGRGQPDRTREAWFAVDLLLQLGLLSVQGAPVARRATRPGRRKPPSGQRLNERIVPPRSEKPSPPPRQRQPPPPKPRPLESDDEATDVFAMGGDDEEEDDDDDDSSEEDSLDISVDENGASHVVSFTPGRKRPRPPQKDVGGGMHESDLDASDVFAMGGDDDDDDEEDDVEELEDSGEYFGEVDEDDDEYEDEDHSSSVLEDVSDMEALGAEPDQTAPGDPVALLTSPQAAPLVERFRALRTANPLAVLGYTAKDVAGYITLSDVRKRANKEKGRWHPERYIDQGGDAQEAAAELNSLVERRYEALKEPRVLAAAMREWREQLPAPDIPTADRDRAVDLMARARQQATARAWTAALMTIEEALEADPTNVRCRLVDIHCRVVLEEFDIDSALANIDSLPITDTKTDSEAQFIAGLALKHVGRDDAAQRFARAVELDSDNAAARHELDFQRANNPQGIGGIISGLFGGV